MCGVDVCVVFMSARLRMYTTTTSIVGKNRTLCRKNHQVSRSTIATVCRNTCSVWDMAHTLQCTAVGKLTLGGFGILLYENIGREPKKI